MAVVGISGVAVIGFIVYVATHVGDVLYGERQ